MCRLVFAQGFFSSDVGTLAAGRGQPHDGEGELTWARQMATLPKDSSEESLRAAFFLEFLR